MTEPAAHEVTLILCSLCLDGAGGECHTPGCALWINRAPDLSLRGHPCVLAIDGKGTYGRGAAAVSGEPVACVRIGDGFATHTCRNYDCDDVIEAYRRGHAAGAAQRARGVMAYMDRATALAKQAWPTDEPGPTLSKALFAHLLEEAGELAGASRSFWGRSLSPEKTASLDDVTGELGDVLVIVLRIAATHGADPDRAIECALTKFRKRLDACAPSDGGEGGERG